MAADEVKKATAGDTPEQPKPAKRARAAKVPADAEVKPKTARKAGARPATEKVKPAADQAKPAAARRARAPKAQAEARPEMAQAVPAEPATPVLAVGRLEGTVVDREGRRLETVKLVESRFGITPDIHALHLVVRAEQASRRRGTASTKTRGEVSGTTAKMYRQKGTGRARAGSAKSPLRTGGGTAFGPHPRSYGIKVNRKVVRKALAMALSSRADMGNVFVARDLQLDAPSTAALNRMLVALDVAAPVLVVTHAEPVVTKSVRNLTFAEAAEVQSLTTEQVLRARSLVFTEKAFAALNQA